MRYAPIGTAIHIYNRVYTAYIRYIHKLLIINKYAIL
jgi:hypothetical protein